MSSHQSSKTSTQPVALRLVPIRTVLDRLNVCRTVLYGYINSEIFPPPIKLKRSSRWSQDDVNAFVRHVTRTRALPPARWWLVPLNTAA